MAHSPAKRQTIPGFRPARALCVDSRSIRLALDEAQLDGLRPHGFRLDGLERVTLSELETYHRQLFYWLLIREGPLPGVSKALRPVRKRPVALN